MHVLKVSLRSLLVAVAVLALTATTTTQNALAHPPAEPDHGINESTFWTLWAGDADRSNVTDVETLSSIRTVSAGTDVPLDSPPRAVETWNTGEHSEHPITGPDRAVHPQQAPLTDGEYLRDVGVSMMALQPSTRVHLDEDAQPRYIAPNGTVLGTVDYRIAVPSTNSFGSRYTEWRLRSHEVESVRIVLDGEVLDETQQTKTPELTFSGLTPDPTAQRTLTIEATVLATLERTVTREYDRCTAVPHTPSADTNTTTNETREVCRTDETSTVTQIEDRVTVSDSRAVRVYALTVSGFQAQYPNGDTGLVTYKSYPWYGLSLPDGEVRGVWRFYVARNPSWDQQTTYDSEGTRTSHSPVHPLEVHAYPIESGPTPWPRSQLSIIDVYGETYDAPALPAKVNLDSIEGPYTGSLGIGVRAKTSALDLRETTAVGLVRGTNTPLQPENFESVPLSKSNLTLEVTNQTDESITVQAWLRSADTGDPISTMERDGQVIVAGQRVETNESGLASVTVSRDRDAISARYEPGLWWMDIPGYTGDTAVVHTGGTGLQYVDTLFRGFVPIGMFLFGGYLISRITTWGFWPPWRGL